MSSTDSDTLHAACRFFQFNKWEAKLHDAFIQICVFFVAGYVIIGCVWIVSQTGRQSQV